MRTVMLVVLSAFLVLAVLAISGAVQRVSAISPKPNLIIQYYSCSGTLNQGDDKECHGFGGPPNAMDPYLDSTNPAGSVMNVGWGYLIENPPICDIYPSSIA